MEIQKLIQKLNNTHNINEKANLIGDAILTYRKNVAPFTAYISDYIFNSGLVKEDVDKLITQINKRVVDSLVHIYPKIDSLDFKLDYSDKDVLIKARQEFNKKYLIEKKWQSKPYLLPNNFYGFINFVPKYPFAFFNENGTVEYENKELEVSQKIYNNDIVLNSSKFFINKNLNTLFSIVTTLKFSPITSQSNNSSNFKKTINNSEIYDEAEYKRALDICTYLIPKAKAEDAINVMRYDGTGFEHKNQVFYSDKHKQIFGEKATVPHFHFQSSVENLLYLKKSKKDDNDNSFVTAGCNAIDCDHLIAYLKNLQETSKENLGEDDFGMPFYYAKKFDLQLSVNTNSIIKTFISSSLENNAENLEFVQQFYKELNLIRSKDDGYINDNNNSFNSGNNNSENANSNQPTSFSTNSATKNFDELIGCLKMLKLTHKELEKSENLETIKKLVKIELVVAYEAMQSMFTIEKSINPQQNKDKGGKWEK